MKVDHSRLIYADERNPTFISHHCSRSGEVHNGHPRLCDDQACRIWGDRLMQEARARTERIIQETEPVHWLHVWGGLLLMVLSAGIVVGMGVVFVKWMVTP